MSVPKDSSETPVAFRGSLTVADAYSAGSLAQPTGNKIATWVVRGFFIAGLLYMVWLFAFALLVADYNLARIAAAGVVLLLIPNGLVVGLSIWRRRLANQLCEARKLLYAFTEGEVDGNSIRSKTETAEGMMTWSAFCGFRENKSVAVLYQQYANVYVIMARSKFDSESDWQRFLVIARQKLVKK